MKTGHYTETYTGKLFYILDFCEDDIDILDIAHGLSLQCRYNGQCKFFYSVAEHSVLIAEAAVRLGKSPKECMRALLHDAPEAYIGDLPRPIKNSVPQVEKVESDIERVIMLKFHLDPEMPAWLKDLDTRIIVDERAQVMNHSNNVWKTDGMLSVGATVVGRSPVIAETNFLGMYNYFLKAILTGEAQWLQ